MNEMMMMQNNPQEVLNPEKMEKVKQAMSAFDTFFDDEKNARAMAQAA